MFSSERFTSGAFDPSVVDSEDTEVCVFESIVMIVSVRHTLSGSFRRRMHNQCVQSQVVEMLGSDYTSLLLGTPANRHFTFEPLEVPKSWGGDPAPTKDLLSDNEISCSVDVSHTENLISFSDTNELVMRLSEAYESVDHFHFPLLKISQ